MNSVGKKWKEAKRHADREGKLQERELERLRKASRPLKVDIKEAAYAVALAESLLRDKPIVASAAVAAYAKAKSAAPRNVLRNWSVASPNWRKTPSARRP